MTYLPTVAYLEAQALAAGAASFWHGKQQTQSINYDAPFPQAHLYLMPDELANGNVSRQIYMSFYGNDALESSWQESAAIIDEMDALTQTFVSLLLDDGQFEVAEVRRATEYRVASQLGTGYFLQFTLTARSLIC